MYSNVDSSQNLGKCKHGRVLSILFQVFKNLSGCVSSVETLRNSFTSPIEGQYIICYSYCLGFLTRKTLLALCVWYDVKS